MACGLVSFALGTDTAGSGRIPAAFNGLTGSKLTRGLISTSGVVPACRSLDCVSLFTRNARDAALIASIATTMDDRDPFARPNLSANAFTRFGRWSGKLTLGVIRPEQLKFFGDDAYADAYQRTLDALSNRGVNLQPIDFPLRSRGATLRGSLGGRAFLCNGGYFDRNQRLYGQSLGKSSREDNCAKQPRSSGQSTTLQHCASSASPL